MLEQRDMFTQKVKETSEESFLTIASKFYENPADALEVLRDKPGIWAIGLDGLLFRYLTKTANDNLLKDLKSIASQLEDVIELDVAYQLMYQITERYGYPILSGEVGLSASLNTKWARLLVTFSPGGLVKSVELIEYTYWH